LSANQINDSDLMFCRWTQKQPAKMHFHTNKHVFFSLIFSPIANRAADSLTLAMRAPGTQPNPDRNPTPRSTPMLPPHERRLDDGMSQLRRPDESAIFQQPRFYCWFTKIVLAISSSSHADVLQFSQIAN
jgi:hypothetical protein